MLVKIGNTVINTQNITLITEEHGNAVLYFVDGCSTKVTLSLSLNDCIRHLEGVGVTVHG